MMDLLFRAAVSLAATVVLVGVGCAVEPPWRAFVARLSGRRVLLLWGAAVAGMPAAWWLPAAGGAGAALRIAMFVAPPVLALAVTIERLHATRPPRRQGGY